MKLSLSLLGILIFFYSQSHSQNFLSIDKLTANDGATSDIYGEAVAIDSDYAIVGAWGQKTDANGANSMSTAGAVYIYEKNSSGNWLQVQKIVPSDRTANDRFGARASLSGTTAAIGAYQDNDDVTPGNTLPKTGSVFLFERNSSGVWIEVQKVVASDRIGLQEFGISVSISGDRMVVGARGEDFDASGNNNLNSAGAAYVFEKNMSGTWVEVQKIVASDRQVLDLFGSTVAISDNRIVVGVRSQDYDANGMNMMNKSGAAYIFERDGTGTWNEVQKIVASDRAAEDRFGTHVSISWDNVIVGSPFEGHDATGGSYKETAGSAYIFERNSSGVWTEVQKLVASDRTMHDNYGESVSIHGSYAIVGARFEDEDELGANTIGEAGSAYIYERNGSGIWNEVQKVVASDRGPTNHFGSGVAINGGTVLIGAAFADGQMTSSGAAYILSDSSIVGVDENIQGFANENELIAYPNPSSDFVQLSGKKITREELRIYNSIGQDISNRIRIIQNGSNTILLDISALEPSVYLISIGTRSVQFLKN